MDLCCVCGPELLEPVAASIWPVRCVGVRHMTGLQFVRLRNRRTLNLICMMASLFGG